MTQGEGHGGKETPKAQPEIETADLEKQIETEKSRQKDYLNQQKYAQANIENLKKEHDQKIEQITNRGKKRIASQLPDIINELEATINAGKSAENPQTTMLEGLEMTLKKLKKIHDEQTQ
ncbi:MAG: nucleotide exchange factor GrpE [Nitrososphaerota archaeon]|jgi:molecular chaperone GrpE (heat shock protein)|nr:nucleotide exchange factor GrpE [Nitrososphaerota archaeon]